MTVDTLAVAPAGHITAPVRLDVSTAHTFRLALLDALDGGASLTVDLSGVDVLDAAGAAVLVGVSHRAAARGHRLAVIDASPAAHAALAGHGLSRCLLAGKG